MQQQRQLTNFTFDSQFSMFWQFKRWLMHALVHLVSILCCQDGSSTADSWQLHMLHRYQFNTHNAQCSGAITFLSCKPNNTVLKSPQARPMQNAIINIDDDKFCTKAYIFYRVLWCVAAWNWRYAQLQTSPKTGEQQLSKTINNKYTKDMYHIWYFFLVAACWTTKHN